MSAYKEELSNLQKEVSTKSSEDERMIKQLQIDKIDMTSKIDTLTFKNQELEQDLNQKKSILSQFVEKYENLSKEFTEIAE